MMSGDAQPTPLERFMRIIDEGMCLGCGLCGVVVPEKISVRAHHGYRAVSDSGDPRDDAVRGEILPHPDPDLPLTEAEVDLIYALCPGVRVEGMAEEEIAAAPHNDAVWGAYHAMTLGWSSEPHVRHQASTGGVLSALARYLLSEDKVDFIIATIPAHGAPSHGIASAIYDKDGFPGKTQSRYGPTLTFPAFTMDLDHFEAVGARVAYIGKPCDMAALRNWAAIDPRIDTHILYRLSPVCGGFMPDYAMDRFMNEEKIKRRQIQEMRYRGDGCPGDTVFHMADGSERRYHYLDFWGEDESAWALPFRCKMCPDGIGEAADVAAADTWQDATPDREESKTDLGVNSIIARTRRGADLVRDAVAAGFLSLGESVDPAYMSATQPHQVVKKKSAAARYLGLADAGHLAPETYGLRLMELMAENGFEENNKQRKGAAERALKYRLANK